VSPTRLLIVDDHEGFRRAARAMLEPAGYEVVGEAGDGVSALRLARNLLPDLVLLDVVLPDTDGFVICERLQELDARPMVVLTSSRDAAAYRRRLETSSALGFIGKEHMSAGSLTAIVVGGGR
jgi:DNA-binding NarL/FixJ family response regulator